MRILLICLFAAFLSACANTAVIRKIEDSDMCGKGITRLLPSESDVWLVLCDDGRVLWMTEEDTL